MSKKSEIVKTKRLVMVPRTKLEMKELIDSETDPHLKSAYEQMLVGMNISPETVNLYTNWKITLKESGKIIGGICFKGGPNARHEVEVGMGIDSEYQNQKYGTEALQAMMDWVLSTPDAYYIQAITEEDNVSSVKLLEGSNFKPVGQVDEGVLFEVEKPKTPWKYVYMLFGIAIGSAIANAADISIGLPMAGGILLGLLIGFGLDRLDESNRKRD